MFRRFGVVGALVDVMLAVYVVVAVVVMASNPTISLARKRSVTPGSMMRSRVAAKLSSSISRK